MRILCVHQGYELYGSDRCFADSVLTIRRCFPRARIDVLLPKDGPLAEVIRPIADEVRVSRLWVIRKRRLAQRLVQESVSLPLALARAITAFRHSDLVYINTIAILDFLVAARFFRSRALLHVHEAPEGLVGAALGALVRCVGAPTIFNSEATRTAYRPLRPEISFVVYNGVSAPVAATRCSYDGQRRLRLLMLGRLSFGKGQDILIDACRFLPRAVLDSIEVRVVGSSFDAQTALERRLLARARAVAGPEVIRFEPFLEDTGPLYDWCDLAIVPSRVREGFGRVAAEAMAYGRASIVAAHGGLTEIVVDRETGWWFVPKDPHALAQAIRHAFERPETVRKYGHAARLRFERCFTGNLIDARLQQILRQRIV